MRMRYAWLIILAAAIPAVLCGQVTGPDFLKMDLGARAMGAGGAFVSLADDSYALYWNPGGLASLEAPEVSFMYLAAFSECSYNRLQAAFPALGGGVGVGVYYSSDPTLVDTDDLGNEIGSLANYDFMLTGGYGMALGPVEAGLAVKYFGRKLIDYSSQGVAADLGLLYGVEGLPLTLGLSVLNLGTQTAFAEEASPLPMQVKGGVTWEAVREETSVLSVSVEGTKPFSTDEKDVVGAGLEYTYLQMFSFRGGYRIGFEKENFTAGLGVFYGGMQFDYAYAPMGYLGANHYMSLAYKFISSAEAVKVEKKEEVVPVEVPQPKKEVEMEFIVPKKQE